MEREAVVRIIALAVGLGIIHWAVVPMVLERLFCRPKVIGSRALWGVAIVCSYLCWLSGIPAGSS